MITVNIVDDNRIVRNLQLWSKGTFPFTNDEEFQRVNYVKYNEIPLVLIQGKPIDVYCSIQDSVDYVADNVLRYKDLGLLCKSKSNENVYLIFYVQDMKLKTLLLDFSLIIKILGINKSYDNETNYILDLKTKSSDTNVFDRVLEKKKRPKSTTPTVQDKGDQINTTVTKVILSGLRLRGLSNSSKDKIKIKEIYQMTYKSTLFALRKFNREVKLNDIQDTVEKLLQIFVDVDIDEDSPFKE
ncbi:mitochondrial morphogenesis protein Sld7p [[Candida] jaroonii]|uniref:Mitochondrial morphogenesis protein Sld7p n=1 Tax=[Candida] jaroonii TaxID=467808 RepID=A0ACA9Y392_9ASCO|nr:mitochondrial morphogenesis protein Sld7p [[Candida] jaroonii]